MTRVTSLLATVSLAVLPAAVVSAPPYVAAPYVATPFASTGIVTRVIPVDLDGDGLRDIVLGRESGVEVYFHDPERGLSLSKADAELSLRGDSVAWDLDRGEGEDTWRLLALVDGRRVTAWTVDPTKRRFGEAAILLEGLQAFLPRGVRHARLLRDVDGDGVRDLVIPGTGVLRVYFGASGGTFTSGPIVHSKAALESRLDVGADLGGAIGQTVKIPVVGLQDLNSDGRPDLVSKSEDRLEVYLASVKGKFPEVPSYALDLTEVRERNRKPDEVDLSNLTRQAAEPYQVELEDINQDGNADLLLREGGKVLFFLGTRTGMDLRKPHQVLKSAGNLLTSALYDEDSDGNRDLWLVRAETISVKDLFVWLVAAGSVEFEAFVYRFDGKRFARRPHRKLTVTLRFPSILSMGDLAEEFVRKSKNQAYVATSVAELGGRAAASDFLAVSGGRLRCYFDAAPTDSTLPGVLASLGYTPEKDKYVLDLEKVLDQIALGTSRELERLSDREPDFEIALGEASDQEHIVITHLNQDDRHDMIILSEWDGAGVRGTILLSREE